MDNKIMKYEENFFRITINKIKSFFSKNKVEEIKQEKKEDIKEEIREEIKEETTNNEKQKFVELVRKFNAREIEEKDLTQQEIEKLTKYYKNRDMELDKEIANQKRILENLNLRLNRLAEKTMALKV